MIAGIPEFLVKGWLLTGASTVVVVWGGLLWCIPKYSENKYMENYAWCTLQKKILKNNSLSVSGWLDATDEADNVVIDGARPGKSPVIHCHNR